MLVSEHSIGAGVDSAAMPRLTVTLSETTDQALRRVAATGEMSSFVEAAIIEKIARDDERSRLDALEARMARIEATFGIEPDV